MRILGFCIVIFCCFVALYSQEEAADLSLKENEKEYYDDSVFDELAAEETIQEENQDSNDSQNEDDGDDEDEDEKNIMKEWEEYMFDFVPADMLTYEIEKSEKEVKKISHHIRLNIFLFSFFLKILQKSLPMFEELIL